MGSELERRKEEREKGKQPITSWVDGRDSCLWGETVISRGGTDNSTETHYL